MSLGIRLLSEPQERRCICECCDNEHTATFSDTLYEDNITHNLGAMAQAVGIYEALWRPYALKPDCPEEFKSYDEEWNYEDSVEVRAKEIIPILEEGLIKLKGHPKNYEQYNSPNGWGTYRNFVPFVERYLKACKENPEAIVNVDR